MEQIKWKFLLHPKDFVICCYFIFQLGYRIYFILHFFYNFKNTSHLQECVRLY